MNATGPTMNRGRTANTEASTRPVTIIGRRATRSATQPKNGSPTRRAAGHAATTTPRVGRSTPCWVK